MNGERESRDAGLSVRLDDGGDDDDDGDLFIFPTLS